MIPVVVLPTVLHQMPQEFARHNAVRKDFLFWNLAIFYNEILLNIT